MEKANKRQSKMKLLNQLAIMDKHLPDWRDRRKLLNSLALAYEDWSY